MEIYDPCCGSAGLLIKCDLVLREKMNLRSRKTFAPAKLYGQENEPGTWAMANMNMIIHDMEGEIQIGDTFRKPKFRAGKRLRTFDRVVANPMWNQLSSKRRTTTQTNLAYAQFTSMCVVPEFVFWYMQTRYDHLRSISQGGGSTKGALTCGFLNTYPIAVPSEDEQREIAEVFAVLDRKEKLHQRKHAVLKDLFRTVLHELMTGQIRVHKHNIESVTRSLELR